MKILVIGNGFDLAHGLPTKYTDFLEFCERVFPIYENVEGRGVQLYQLEWLFDWNFNKEIKEKLKSAYESRRKVAVEENKLQIQTNYPRLDEMYSIIKNNIWIEYFFQCKNMNQKENWIDFENEISQTIKSIEGDLSSTISHRFVLEDTIQCITNKFLKNKYNDWVGNKTYKELRDVMLDDLNKLTRALEIYLCEYVEKIQVKIISPDIKEIVTMGYEELLKKTIIYCNIICFNYTNTLERMYLCKSGVEYNEYKEKIDYIHGRANINNSIKTNNMVLGIDEYLEGDRKNKDVEFIAFKKYYQRIYKGTGNKYKKLLDIVHESHFEHILKKAEKARKNMGYIPDDVQNELNYIVMSEKKNQKHGKHYLYIFGHSLDIADKDILRDLILNDNVYTIVFYHNKDVLGRQIVNLVKVIGQDELIRRTGGIEQTIEFKQQKPMIPIEE